MDIRTFIIFVFFASLPQIYVCVELPGVGLLSKAQVLELQVELNEKQQWYEGNQAERVQAVALSERLRGQPTPTKADAAERAVVDAMPFIFGANAEAARVRVKAIKFALQVDEKFKEQGKRIAMLERKLSHRRIFTSQRKSGSRRRRA